MKYDLSEIKHIRKQLGITQKELANLANVSQSLIAKIESNSIDPTYTNANKIFTTLDILSKKEEKKVNEIMNSKIISVKETQNICDAIKLMKNNEISQLVVLDENKKPSGFISEKILIDMLLENKSKDTIIKNIMMDCPPIISLDSPIQVASHLLKFYPIVIVNKNSKFKGIITKSDIIVNMFN